jgi:hypothetical protein
MILWHKHCDIFDACLCEGLIYHTSDGISSPMTTYGSPISDKLLPLPQPPVRARTDARTHVQIQAPREPPN